MNRNLATYADAVQRVKIGYFTEKLNCDITGVIHVGTNYGYEIKWYLAMGIEPQNILGFEPLRSAQKQCQYLFPDVACHGVALGNAWATRELLVHAGDGQGSTLLRELNPDPNTILLDMVQVQEWPFEDFYHLRYGRKALFPFNCLVIDVQGYELQVLQGFGDYLKQIDFISAELSSKPLYEGQAPAHEVSAFLNLQGFAQYTEIEPHNDVMFARPSAVPKKVLT